jgi:hypothetical protein
VAFLMDGTFCLIGIREISEMSYTDDAIQYSKDMFKLISTVGSFAGFIVVFFYCLDINFFPVGITTGGALLFIWAVISFSLIYTVFIFLIYIANSVYFYLIAKIINKLYKEQKITKFPLGNDRLLIFTFGPIAQFFIVIISCSSKALSILSVFSSQIFMLILYFIKYCYDNNIVFNAKENKETVQSKEDNKPSYRYNILYIMVYISIPLIIGQVGGSFIRIAFILSGIRQNNVVIYFDKSYQNILEARINKFNNSEKENIECLGKDICYIENVNILFTYIGSKVLFEIPIESDKKNGISKALKLELPASAIKGIEREIDYSNK